MSNTPQEYRKKPVVVEAIQLTGSNMYEVADWINVHEDGAAFTFLGSQSVGIHTLEGIMVASPGDYIIKGVQGEFYPCRPDVFEQTYEKVTA